MQFNSYEFIVIFMPLLFAGYFLANRFSHTLGKLVLIGMGGYFYVYYGFASAPLLLASLIINYTAAWLIVSREKYAKLIFTLDIAVNIALLFYFKYFSFILSNINQLMHSDFQLDILLPIGISFYTFQQILYVLNVYKKGRNEKLIDYLLYVMYFPKLVMGPITDPEYLIPQFNDAGRKRVNAENIACGIKTFSMGFFKKVIFADTFAAAVAWCMEDITLASSADLFLTMLAYTFEIYFDFSSYCDMAVGASLILNIDLPINFDSPYRSLSIREFWQRWHMTLTAFFSKTVYFPMGGSRCGKARLYFNIMTVFILSGIWHGANWTFLVWGFLNGILIVGERVFEKHMSRINDTAKWLYTFVCTNFLMLLVRAESMGQWLKMIRGILSFESMAVSDAFLKCFEIQEAQLLISTLHLSSINGVMALLFYVSALFICLVPENNFRRKDRLSPAGAVLAVLAFFFGFIHLGGESIFVYFNF